MSERQCHLPCGVSTAGELTPYRPFFAREKISFQRKGTSTMREASLDTTFFGGVF
jgi:hypothetical protein